MFDGRGLATKGLALVAKGGVAQGLGDLTGFPPKRVTFANMGVARSLVLTIIASLIILDVVYSQR